MGLRQAIIKGFVKAGIALIDILILGLALVYIYLAAQPVDDIGLVAVDTMMILITVVVLYLVIVAAVSLCLTYMREDNGIAKVVKSFVSILLVMTLFNFIIFPLMWLMGYSLGADVQIVLIVASIIRLIAKIFLKRYFGRYFI